MEDLLSGMREQVGPLPRRLANEPGRTGEVAAEARGLSAAPAQTDPETASVDDLLKVALVKLVQGNKSKKSKRLPGLLSWEESGGSSTEEKEAGWSSTSRGGRGIEAVERLRSAMKAHPEAYQERMESQKSHSWLLPPGLCKHPPPPLQKHAPPSSAPGAVDDVGTGTAPPAA